MNKKEKQEKWESLEEKFKKMADGMGMPLDEGIFETVVVINAIGITTIQSCEGHLDRGYGGPWVEVGERIEEEIEAYQKIMDEADKLADKIGIDSEKVRSLYDKAHARRKEAKRKHLETIQVLLDYLREFYSAREGCGEERLYVKINNWDATHKRLQGVGADFNDVLPKEERRENLKIYQKEMRDFTKFLKKKYFDG